MLRTITEKERIAFFIEDKHVINLTPRENSALVDVDEGVPLKGEAQKLLAKNCYTLAEMAELNLWYVNEFTGTPLVRKSFDEEVRFTITNPVFGILTTNDFKSRLSDENKLRFENWMGPEEPVKSSVTPFLKFQLRSDFNGRTLSWESDGDVKTLSSKTLFGVNQGELPDGNYTCAQIKDLDLYQVIDCVAYSFFADPDKGKKYYINICNGLHPFFRIHQAKLYDLD